MLKQWVVWLAVAGVAYVAGNQCDTEDVRICYEDLVQYETIVFPLYGENEAKLDDTCGNMNISFNCIRSYVETCHGNGECDINCTKLIKEIHSFLRISGLMKLYENLCEKSNALRQTYLESAECLEDTADLYAACHNVSQESRHFMHTTEGANTIEGNCCYLSWYRDCFTNTTRNNCGENATIIVSIAAHLLLGEISDQLCSSEPAFCDTPPLPTDTSPTDNEIDKNSYPNDHELDKDKPDETNNEIDNTIDDTKNAATTLYASTVIVLPYVFSILFKYIL